MKKFTSIIFGICVVLLLTACTNGQESPETSDLTNEPPNTESIAGDSIENNPPADGTMNASAQNNEVNIQIAFATDELLSRYENFHEFIHVEEAEYMIISTDAHVTDFEFVWLNNSFELLDWDVEEDTELHFFVENVIYSAGELTPEMPFKVRTWGDWGHLPRIGVSFTDTNGVARYFHIQQSMMDGALNITEFENMADATF